MKVRVARMYLKRCYGSIHVEPPLGPRYLMIE